VGVVAEGGGDCVLALAGDGSALKGVTTERIGITDTIFTRILQ
jgi:hypothetical protein